MLKFVNYDIVFQEVPNEVTLSINISNCPHKCRGCHSAYLQEDTGEELTEEILTGFLNDYKSEITCVCFMGGDASPEDVVSLAAFLKRQTVCPVKVAWYSGSEKLPDGFDPVNFDYIKIGPYIEEKGGLAKPTTNQHFYKVTGDKMEDITSVFWKKGPLG
ncbi:MAG: anaerobic ribonucleoside-triphosphate reductase activating protein [Bacteroidales bacterium]|jgi:anaerobic ribonucleoside-triphosphate reductase activating protein|nr:anaerobic ribonucleoside-triphosphate reductase activating protein [Bacteroidales bacterium]